MDRLAGIFPLARADEARGQNVYARAHTDQKARVERGKRCRGADGAERVRPGKLPDDGDVRHVEQYLQQVRRHQRQAENQYLLPEIPVRHVPRIVAHGDQASKIQSVPDFTRHRHTIAPKTGFGNGIFRTFLHKKRCPTRRGFCSRNTKNPRHFPLPGKHSGQTREKTLDFASACWYNVLAKRAQRLWSGIEVVITALTRNQVYRQRYRGFESHPLRQKEETRNRVSLLFGGVQSATQTVSPAGGN